VLEGLGLINAERDQVIPGDPVAFLPFDRLLVLLSWCEYKPIDRTRNVVIFAS